MVIAASNHSMKPLYSFKSRLNFGVSNFDDPVLTLLSSVSRVPPGPYLAASPVFASNFTCSISFSIFSTSLCMLFWSSSEFFLDYLILIV